MSNHTEGVFSASIYRLRVSASEGNSGAEGCPAGASVFRVGSRKPGKALSLQSLLVRSLPVHGLPRPFSPPPGPAEPRTHSGHPAPSCVGRRLLRSGRPGSLTPSPRDAKDPNSKDFMLKTGYMNRKTKATRKVEILELSVF